MQKILSLVIFFAVSQTANSQSFKGVPSLPKGGAGIQGSAGAGFADFKTLSPSSDFKQDRGTYIATSIERGFDFLHLYLTFGLSFMDAQGVANYAYTNLSSSTNYTLNDVDFRAKTYEAALGFKFKIIDDYWFRPYAEVGGVANYNEVSYGSKISQLSATGSDYKRKDVIMGSGYYGEGGIEIQFAEKFGIRLAARQTVMQTKKLETLQNRPLRLQTETYYLSVLFGI